MKSFKLAPENSWNALANIAIFTASGLLLVIATNMGVLNSTLHVIFVLFFLVFMGLIATGRVRDRLERKYPDANSLWLLVFSATVSVFGVCVRVVFLENKLTIWDCLWLTVVFFSTALFILKNKSLSETFNGEENGTTEDQRDRSNVTGVVTEKPPATR